jgi:hypothetical protein
MSRELEARWPIEQVLLAVGMPLFILALSMDWFGGAGVGFGDVLRGADREPTARAIGVIGYLACAPAFFVFLEIGVVDRSRRQLVIVAEWLALLGTLIAFAGGLVLATGVRSGDQMEPGFPLFCCAAVCMLLGLLACWPKGREKGLRD